VGRPRPDCCYDDEFDEAIAERDLRAYRRHGPGRTTRMLADALATPDVAGMTVLDIGGGIGSLHRLLIEAGAASAVDVDASGPYLEAARAEADRLGLSARVAFVHGDLVSTAESDVAAADLVALDRVVCCYPDVDALVGAAARLTKRRLGIAVPPDGPLARLAIGTINAWQRVIRSRLRMHAHAHAAIAAAAASFGLVPRAEMKAGLWRVLVFERPVERTGVRRAGSP
jgi:magnesium-protoporphyrin O-methyltransferase